MVEAANFQPEYVKPIGEYMDRVVSDKRIEAGKQKPVVVVGHIDDKRNFTHVKDMVRAYWLAVEKCKPGKLYLIGTEDKAHIHTFRQALEQLIRMSTVKGITHRTDKKYVRPTQVPYLICDATEFVQATKWKARISFDQILSDTLDYWRLQVGSRGRTS